MLNLIEHFLTGAHPRSHGENDEGHVREGLGEPEGVQRTSQISFQRPT